MGANRPPASRYPRGSQPGGRKQTPQRTRGQQVRLWVLSLCCALPGAVMVYVTQSFWKGAGLFLLLAIVLGFVLVVVEKQLAHKRDGQ